MPNALAEHRRATNNTSMPDDHGDSCCYGSVYSATRHQYPVLRSTKCSGSTQPHSATATLLPPQTKLRFRGRSHKDISGAATKAAAAC